MKQKVNSKNSFIQLNDIKLKNNNDIVIPEPKEKFKIINNNCLNPNKHSSKRLKKQLKTLSQNFKIITIYSNINEENHILFNLLKKCKCKSAYITPHLLSYGQKKIYFDNFDTLLLIKIFIILKNKKYTHILFNIPPEQFDGLSSIKYNYCIIDTNSLKNKIFIKQIKKKILNKFIIYQDSMPKSFIKSKILTYGSNGDYKITEIYPKKKMTIINFEYQYSKYNLTSYSTNKHIINNYIVSMIVIHQLGYELLDIIKILNKLH